MAARVGLLLLLLLLSPENSRNCPKNCPENSRNAPENCLKNCPKNPPENPPNPPENSPENPHCGSSQNCPEIPPENPLICPKSSAWSSRSQPDQALQVLTVATEGTDGYRRFLRSARSFNYSVRTLGLGRPWQGGDVATSPGGGQKVRWLQEELRELRDRGGLVVLFVDSYDVVFSAGPQELLAKFRSSQAGVLFAAEAFCWPREELAQKYPKNPAGGKPFLNSGGLVGFAPALWALVQRWHLRDDDDDQLFYTELYLDPNIREQFGLALDHHSHIFQNLNGALGEVTIRFEPGGNRVRNELSGALPVVIHGNGPTKIALNSLSNYIPQGWSPEGCWECERDRRELRGLQPSSLPWVLVGVFIAHPTPFLPQFLRRLREISYPRSRLGLFLHNAVPGHAPLVEADWPRLQRHFSSAQRAGEGLGGGAARELGMSLCRQNPQCDYYLSLDSDVTLSDPRVLRELLETNRLVVAPLLSRPGHLWSNFWGALSPDGYYARSGDYVSIVRGERRGVWNVPYVSHAYLVGGAALRGALGAGPVFDHAHLDPDMAFCARAREQGLFLFVTNLRHFGHLVVTQGYNSSRRHPELWERHRNPWDWEQQYVHPNYSQVLQEQLIQQPCPDVFQFPLFSEQFARELREEAELRGGWAEHHQVFSQALPLSHLQLDSILQGALQQLLPPIARKLFPGYTPKGRTVLSSVVRYGHAPSGHAHSDHAHPARPRPTATISLSVSLSDSRAGGWRFPRYGCEVTAPPAGWALLHPGRLTHLAERIGTSAAQLGLGASQYGLELLWDP